MRRTAHAAVICTTATAFTFTRFAHGVTPNEPVWKITHYQLHALHRYSNNPFCKTWKVTDTSNMNNASALIFSLRKEPVSLQKTIVLQRSISFLKTLYFAKTLQRLTDAFSREISRLLAAYDIRVTVIVKHQHYLMVDYYNLEIQDYFPTSSY